jgi:N-acetylmuramoyl-L-alanine amidase
VITRKIRAVLALTLTLTLWLPTFTVEAASGAGNCFSPTYPNSTTPKIVVLDAGHGGTDSGTSNTVNGVIYYEKDLTLDLAFRTKDLLVNDTSTATRYKVCLTRTGDIDLTNTQRAQYANSVGGQALVLIHLNGASDHTVDYTRTYWGKKNKDEAFSTVMYNALYPGLGIPGQGVGQFASGALLKSNMPSTLTESVFLTNDSEAMRLADANSDLTASTRRNQISQALSSGINGWFKSH